MENPNKTYEHLKIQIDKVVDARGIIFSDKLIIVSESLQSIEPGEMILIYCSDLIHKEKIPTWVEQNNHHLISIIDERNYFKIIIKKGKKNNITQSNSTS